MFSTLATERVNNGNSIHPQNSICHYLCLVRLQADRLVSGSLPPHNMSKGGLSSIIFALLFIALRLNGRLIDHFNNHWGISIVKCDYSIFIIWNFLLNSYSPILITKYFRFKSRGNSNHFVPLVVTI